MTPEHPRGCVVSFALFLVSPSSQRRGAFVSAKWLLHADRTVIFIVIIALNVRADL